MSENSPTPKTFNPYYEWLGIPEQQLPATHYRLLGLENFETNPAAIANGADRAMAFVRTFQTGKHSAESQQLLNELATARVCLLNADQKSAYDETLRRKLAIPDTIAPPSAPPPSPPPLPRESASDDVLEALIADLQGEPPRGFSDDEPLDMPSGTAPAPPVFKARRPAAEPRFSHADTYALKEPPPPEPEPLPPSMVGRRKMMANLSAIAVLGVLLLVGWNAWRSHQAACARQAEEAYGVAVRGKSEGRYDVAQQEIQRAISLDPKSAYIEFSRTLALEEAALRQARQSHASAVALLREARYAEALGQAELALATIPASAGEAYAEMLETRQRAQESLRQKEIQDRREEARRQREAETQRLAQQRRREEEALRTQEDALEDEQPGHRETLSANAVAAAHRSALAEIQQNARLARVLNLSSDGLCAKPAVSVAPTDLLELARLARLEELDFSGTQVFHSEVRLPVMHHVRVLNLSGCPTMPDSALKVLESFPALEELNLAGCDRITAFGMEQIKGLRNLRKLDLSQCSGVGSKGVAHLGGLVQLERLSLADCHRLTDDCLIAIGDLANLRELSLNGCTNITDSGIAKLKNLTQLEDLYLFNTKLTGQGLVYLKNMRKLENLNLRQTQVNNTGLIYLKDLPELKRVNAQGTRITKQGAVALRRFLPRCEVFPY